MTGKHSVQYIYYLRIQTTSQASRQYCIVDTSAYEKIGHFVFIRRIGRNRVNTTK